jgi:hypothetical protein
VNGYWTSDTSDLKQGRVTNPIHIQVSQKGKGTISMRKDIYKITLFTNMKLSGIHQKKKDQTILFDFLVEDKTNPLQEEQIPRTKVTIYQKDKKISEFFSYKLFQLEGISGELSRLILSQNYFPSPKLQYDIHTYQKYINHFKYPFKPFMITYGNVSSGTFYNKIQKNYDEKIMLGYKREYYAYQKETIMTPLSKMYELKAINHQGKLFNKIELGNIEEEKRINHIARGFIPKATYIYIFKMKSVKNQYSFPKSINEEKRSFQLLNNATSIFSKNNINLPSLNDTLLTIQGTYAPILLKTVKMNAKDEKMKIQISMKEVENVL